MIAAALWALDGLIRSHLTENIPSIAIVFYEHLVGFILLLPFFIKAWKSYKTLNAVEWIQFIILVLVSSVLGTALFTEAFARSAEFYDFVTPNLLQKLQPVFVVFFSWLMLREKISMRFISLAGLALVGSYLVTFGSETIDFSFTGKEMVFVLAIGAALAWGFGTILSKRVLQKLSFSGATAMRFGLAIPISFIFMLVQGKSYTPTDISGAQWLLFLAIAIATGAGAILIYYRGLKITQAKVSTFAELMYPIMSLIIATTAWNPFGEPQKLMAAQIAGIVILIGAIIAIGLTESPSRNNKAIDTPASV